jgi:hypothetical protein
MQRCLTGPSVWGIKLSSVPPVLASAVVCRPFLAGLLHAAWLTAWVHLKIEMRPGRRGRGTGNLSLENKLRW